MLLDCSYYVIVLFPFNQKISFVNLYNMAYLLLVINYEIGGEEVRLDFYTPFSLLSPVWCFVLQLEIAPCLNQVVEPYILISNFLDTTQHGNEISLSSSESMWYPFTFQPNHLCKCNSSSGKHAHGHYLGMVLEVLLVICEILLISRRQKHPWEKLLFSPLYHKSHLLFLIE